MPLLPPTDAIKDSLKKSLTKAAQSGVEKMKSKLDVLDLDSQKAPSASKRLESEKSTNGQPSARNANDTFFDLKGWNENALSGVLQPTYNIRLFMVEDTPLFMEKYESYQAFCDAISKKQQTTIAATGVSDINIVSLTMESIPGLNKQTRSMQATRMTMVLKEPMGVSFLDLVAETARELRIRNFAKCYYMLEVSFMGYEDGGNFTVNPCAGEKFTSNNGRWLYQVAIQNIDTKMDSTGGEYTIKMIPYQEQMYDDYNLALPENVNVTGTTVVEILNNVATAMNDAVVYSQGFQAKKYSFKFYDLKMGNKVHSMDDFKVTPTKEEFGHKRNYSMDAATANSIKAHFPQGTSVNDIVELVFANCTEAQKLLLNVTTQDELTKIQTEKKDMRKSVLFKVEVTADLLSGGDDSKGGKSGEDTEYDYSTGNYIIHYTLHVLPYFTQTPILTQNDVRVSQDTQVQIENARMLRENGYLSKKYEYLFTGLNTEVINLDVKYNMVWSAVLPRVLGTGTSQEANAVADKKDPSTEQKISDQREVMRQNQEIYRRRQDKLAANEAEVARLTKLSVDPNKNKEVDQQLANAKKAQTEFLEDKADEEKANKALEARNKALAELKRDRSVYQNEQLARRTPRKTDDARGGSHLFAEDVLQYSSEDNRNLMPVSTVQDSRDARYIAQGSIADQNTGDRSVYGAVLNQLYEGVGFYLASIKMDIKGDPYWLGATNMERAYLNTKRPSRSQVRLLESEQIEIDQPNYQRGEVMFVVQFKYPRGYDGESGAPIIKNNDYFTGVYQVVKITHQFSGGVFKQTIDAKRQALMDVFKAFGYRDPKEEQEKKEAQEKAAAEKKAAEQKK
jgi:hypothetical protein